MNAFDNLIRSMTDAALDVLENFDKQKAVDAGLDPLRANAWNKLKKVYFGSTTSPQKQRLAREKARRGRFSLDQLALVEKQITKIASHRTRSKLRLSLLDATGDYKALRRLAKRLVPGDDSPPRKQVTFSRSRGRRRTMTVTGDERDLADLEYALTIGADTSKPVAPQMLERFLQLMRGYNPKGSPAGPSPSGAAGAGRGESGVAETAAGIGDAGDAGDAGSASDSGGAGDSGITNLSIPHAVPRPLILIPLPDWVKIHQGRGDETILQLTDGTTMTGAEFLNQYYATAENYLEAATFHPEEGAVNLYRGRRLANAKQRTLARATSPTCPVPGCRRGADACEIHHITAWKHGGETNVANLAPLCRYHNRVNDDDPARSRRGRIVNANGTPVWRSPRGYLVRNTTRGAMDALFA